MEGRLITARFGRALVVNRDFLKGSGTKRDNCRVRYKLDSCAAVFARMQALRRRGAIFIIGDFNMVHGEIDLPSPSSQSSREIALRMTLSASDSKPSVS